MARRKVYGYWDCEYCGKKGIRGDHRECTGCGQPRSAGVKFYIIDPNAPEVIEQENLHKFSGKADWVCSYCNALNPSESEQCKGCGANREESEKNYFTSHSADDVYDQKTGTWSKSAPHTEPEPKKISDRMKRFLIGGGIVLASIIFIGVIFSKKSIELTVEEPIWKTEVCVEESYESFESDWYLPEGARLEYTKEEEYTYWVSGSRHENFRSHKLPVSSLKLSGTYNISPCDSRETLIEQYDGDDISMGIHESDIKQHELIPLDFYDNGDGSFDWDDGGDDWSDDDWDSYDDDDGYWVTEWRTRYYYYITRWRPSTKYTNTGNKSEPIAFKDDISLADNERIGSRNEEFFVSGTSPDSKITYFSIDRSEWDKLEAGKTYTVHVGRFIDKDHITRVYDY